MSASDKPPMPSDERAVSDLARGIEETRAGMTATITKLEQRLSPHELGGMAKAELDHLETRVKAVMKEGMQEARGVLDEKILAAKEAAREEILEVKGAVKEILDEKIKAAKDAAREEILEVKGAVKEILDEKIKAAKDAVHDEVVEVRTAVKDQLHETKDLVTRGLSDARHALKQDIQGAIAHTRQSIRDATLGRVEDIATQAGDAMTQTRDTLVDTIRQNPIPAAVAGIGLAWLLMNRSSASKQKSHGQDDRFQGGAYGGFSSGHGAGVQGFNGGDAFQGAQHAVSEAASVVARHATSVAHQVGGAIDHAGAAVAGMARDTVSAAQSGVGQGMGAVSHAVDAAGQAIHGASDATTRFAHQTRDAAGNLVHTTVDAAGNLMHTTLDAAGNVVHTATSAVGHVAQQAQNLSHDFAVGAASQARRVERSLEDTLHKNPLALGAVALAVGAAVGYSLPRTQRENELLGDMRGRMLDGASHLAQDASHSLLGIASEAGDSVKEAIGAAAK